MEDWITRIWENLGGRFHGPLSFRLVLQPAVAAALAIRAGFRDARAGEPAYLWTILRNPAGRRALLQDGWRAVARVFIVAGVIDVVYQVVVFRWVYPGEVLIVSFLLACVPYLLIRGPANRIAVAIRGTNRP